MSKRSKLDKKILKDLCDEFENDTFSNHYLIEEIQNELDLARKHHKKVRQVKESAIIDSMIDDYLQNEKRKLRKEKLNKLLGDE